MRDGDRSATPRIRLGWTGAARGLASGAALAVAALSPAFAGDGGDLARHIVGAKRSGYVYAAPDTRALQDDDDSNPAFLWVDRGQGLWEAKDGGAGQSCAACHGAVARLAGVAAAYPKWDPNLERPVTLAQRIQQCRTERMRAEPWPAGSSAPVALATLVALQSRGMPVAVDVDGPMRAWWERGRDLYQRRHGQYDMACKHCHDDYAGRRLRSELLSQGHGTGFPAYRITWQQVGSLEDRVRGCFEALRAEPWPAGGDEHVALEVYLADRARGLPMEAPAVRK